MMGKILHRLFSRRKQVQQPNRNQSRTPSQLTELEEKLSAWVAGKGYRIPDRTLTETAQRIGTDTLTLQRYFRERMQTDFRSWRTGLRVEDAKEELLKEPDVSTTLIAYRVGFSDRSNFSRQFTTLSGMTPSEWRRKAGTDTKA